MTDEERLNELTTRWDEHGTISTVDTDWLLSEVRRLKAENEDQRNTLAGIYQQLENARAHWQAKITEEREECAKVAEDRLWFGDQNAPLLIADAIRARGKK